jgi:hypothetical protein
MKPIPKDLLEITFHYWESHENLDTFIFVARLQIDNKQCDKEKTTKSTTFKS